MGGSRSGGAALDRSFGNQTHILEFAKAVSSASRHLQSLEVTLAYLVKTIEAERYRSHSTRRKHRERDLERWFRRLKA